MAASFQVPLAEVANIGLSTGAFYIYRERQERYIPVKFSVRGRDLGGAVLRRRKESPPRSSCRPAIVSTGLATSSISRMRVARLAVAVPIAIAVVLLLLYVSFGSDRHADRRQRDSARPDRRHPRPLPRRYVVQHLGGHRFRRPVRHRRDERHHGREPLQRLIESGLERDGAAPDLRPADAAGADDLHRRLRRPAARRLFDGDRQPGPAPLAIVVVGGGMLLAPILFLTVLPSILGTFSRRRVFPATSEA